MTCNPLRWFRRTKPIREAWPLSTELLRWTKREAFTLDDATKGLQIWGMTGSGKSSGSGRTLALTYLNSDFGGIVLVAKPGEADAWREYARLTSRTDDLVIFSPAAPFRFNVLQYELARPGIGAGLTENVVQLLMTVAEMASRTAGRGGQDGEKYWQNALQQLLRNAVDVVTLATGQVSVASLYRLIISAPVNYEQATSEGWRKSSFCWQCLQHAEKAPKTALQEHDFAIAADYFLMEYPGLSEKTRSIIVSTFTSMADGLNRGILRELFGTTTNLTPEDCLAGKVVVVDLSVKEYAEIGVYAATLWKYQFQRCIERRDVRVNPRPCFLWADEAQLFTTKFDALFQTTARSSRCCTVYLTQGINNYLVAYGGDAGEAQTKALLGNLTTHIVHALGDAETMQVIAELIGRSKQMYQSGNITHQPYCPVEDLWGGGTQQTSGGWSEQLQYTVDPAELGRMATGGPQHRFQVEGLVWRGGRPFASTGQNFLWTSFQQHHGA